MKATKEQIRAKYEMARERLNGFHLRQIANSAGPVVLISTTYPGVWLEHAFDGLCYAKLFDEEPGAKQVAENQMLLFIENQLPDGHLPYKVLDKSVENENYASQNVLGFKQLQECVSFGTLCLETYRLTQNGEFLRKAYKALQGWIRWQTQNRMTLNRGLVETFCVYDTGHDRSQRLYGVPNTCLDAEGKEYVADGVLPLISPDVNAVFYGNMRALAEMAQILGEADIAAKATTEAENMRQRMFELLYDESDDFFYDVDRNLEKRRIKSISITNVFTEKVLDREQFESIYNKYFLTPEYFGTPYPFPSLSFDDALRLGHAPSNCWGYYSQALTTLRAQRWMDSYGKTDDYNNMLEKWVNVYASQEELLFHSGA